MSSDSDVRDSQADEIIAAYCRAVDKGDNPDIDDWCGRYPECAEELRDFLGAQNCVQQLQEEMDERSPTSKFGVVSECTPTAVRVGQPRPLTTNLFGDYEILTELGRGGMGVIYKARQRSLGRVVALKMILGGQFASDDDVRRFRMEAEAVACLDHPGIVPIHEVGERDGQHFFSMKFIEGSNLAVERTAVAKEPNRAVRIMSAVARAVHHAHQHGILHRDLKPGNVLLDTESRPVVTDFGLAKRLDQDSNLTRSGALIGTPNYMSPEQAAGDPRLTTVSDVFSMGAIFYELLTERKPFQAETLVATLALVREAEPPRPRDLRPGLDADLETICLKCLRKEPRDRYRSAEEFADDLDRYLAGEPIQARAAGVWERALKWIRRRPGVAAAGAIVSITLVSSLAVVTWQWREARWAYAHAEIRAENERIAKERAEEALRRSTITQYIRQVALAQHDAETGRMGNALRALQSCPEEHRDWEWYYANDGIGLRTFEDRDVIALSGDERLMAISRLKTIVRTKASQKENQGIDIVSRLSGKTIASFPDARCTYTRQVLFNKAGNRFAYITTGRVFLCGLPKGDTIASVPVKVAPNASSHMSFSPAGDRLAVWSPNGIQILEEGKAKLLDAGESIHDFCFSADGNRLAILAADKLSVWDLKTDKCVAQLPAENAKAVAFHPEGSVVAIGGAQKRDGILAGSIALWDLGGPKQIHTLWGRALFSNVAFSPDGKVLASASEGLVKLWDTDTGKEICTSFIDGAHFPSLCFSNDGQRLILGSHAGVKSWNVTFKSPMHSFQGQPVDLRRMEFSPDGKELATVGSDPPKQFGRAFRYIVLREAATGAARITLREPGEDLRCLAYSLQGNTLATGGERGGVRLWNVRNGDGLQRFAGRGAIGQVAFVDKETALVALSDDEVKAWDLASGEAIGSLPSNGKSFRVLAAAPAEPRVFLYQQDRGVLCWNPRTGETRTLAEPNVIVENSGGILVSGESRPPQFVTSMSVSEDGSCLTLTNSLGIYLFELPSGRLRYRINPDDISVSQAVFMPGGRRIVSTVGDGKVKLWDTTTGLETLTLSHGNSPVRAVATSRDGRSIAGAAFDGKVRIWTINR